MLLQSNGARLTTLPPQDPLWPLSIKFYKEILVFRSDHIISEIRGINFKVIRDASHETSMFTQELKDLYISAEEVQWKEELEGTLDSGVSLEQIGRFQSEIPDIKAVSIWSG